MIDSYRMEDSFNLSYNKTELHMFEFFTNIKLKTSLNEHIALLY